MEEKEIIVELDDGLQDLIIDEEENMEFEVKSSDVIYSGSTDYNKLKNKPQINNIELKDNRTLNELGIQPKGDYADSRITNTEIEYIFRDW